MILGKTGVGNQAKAEIWANNSRLLAALVAVFFHTNNSALLHLEHTGSSQWWIANYFNALTPWSIAVFVMISGAFLLNPDKNESALTFYKKRAARVLIPLVFWTIFYLVWTYIKGIVEGEPTTLRYLVKSTLMGQPYYHLWYLFMIPGLYLFTPFLRKIVKYSSEKELLILCILLFAFSMSAYAMRTYMDIPELSRVFRWVLFLPYFLIGFWIYRSRVNPNSGLLAVIIIISFIACGTGNYLTTSMGVADRYFFGFFSITIVPISICMMFLLKRLNAPIINETITQKLALLSFGIYLVHPFFLDLLNMMGVSIDLNDVFLSAPTIAILVFLLSLTASMIIIRIPVVKKII